MEPTGVCIIIPNWNLQDVLRDCLASIKNITYPAYETIVIDNGSKDDSVKIVKKEFPDVQLIRNEENLGFAVACNQGIKYALKEHNPEYVFLLNNDTRIVQRDCLEKLVETAQSDDRIGIVSGKTLSPDGRMFANAGLIKRTRLGPEIRVDISSSEKVTEADIVDAAAFLVRRNVIKKIGLLDEGFFPFGNEEFDYFSRTKKAGYKIVYNPKVILIHRRRTSYKKIEQNYLYFISVKNRTRFALLNYPLHQLIFDLIGRFSDVFLPKRNPKAGLTLANIKLLEDASTRIYSFLNACWINLKNLKEILEKRRNRTARIWY